MRCADLRMRRVLVSGANASRAAVARLGYLASIRVCAGVWQSEVRHCLLPFAHLQWQCPRVEYHAACAPATVR